PRQRGAPPWKGGLRTALLNQQERRSAMSSAPLLQPESHAARGDRSPALEQPTSLPRIVEAAVQSVPEVLASLNSSPDGINRIQALPRREQEGPNEIASEKPPRWYVQLLLAFKTPFNLLLLSLAAVSFLTEDYKAAVVIAAMVALSSLLRFVQEYRSG